MTIHDYVNVFGASALCVDCGHREGEEFADTGYHTVGGQWVEDCCCVYHPGAGGRRRDESATHSEACDRAYEVALAA